MMKNTALKRMFRHNRRKVLTEYITIDNSCYCGRRSDDFCGNSACYQKVVGASPPFIGKEWKIEHKEYERDVKLFFRRIAELYEYDGKNIVTSLAPDPGTLFAIGTINTNVECVEPPYPRGGWPGNSDVVHHLAPEIESLVKRADRTYILQRTGHVVPDRDLQRMYMGKSSSLYQMCLNQMPLSMWHIAYGTTNGQKHWTNRSDNLYPTKIVDIALKHAQNRHTHEGTRAHELLPLYNVALDYLYHRLGTTRFIGKMNWGIDIEAIEGRALHAAAGNNQGRIETHAINDYTTLKISPCGKKFESHTEDIQAWLDYLDNPESPFTTEWKLSVKNEIVVHPGKVMTPEEAEKNANKGRTYCTPGSRFSIGELMVGQRMKLERGEMISIGHAWSRGGADKLAQILGVTTIEQGFDEIFQEGDVTGMDHVVYGRDTDFYMSLGLVYDKDGHPDAAARKFITEYIIANLLCRQTQVMAHVWAMIRGEVPSGLQNTSHMDSFQMAFWFVVYILRKAFDAGTSIDDRRVILTMLADWVIAIILYGDDHVFTPGRNPLLLKFFNIDTWRDFLQKYYKVEIRDCKRNATFLSIEKDGVLIHKGICYLKHYFVINPAKDEPCQPLFLPYRESKEVLAKAIVGREIKGTRSPLDVALSCIGHAYGTYAANRDAYDRLKILYELCVEGLNRDDFIKTIVEKTAGDIKGVRMLNRMGITAEELYKGFPTWEMLKEKNKINYAYHCTKMYDPMDLIEEEIY